MSYESVGAVPLYSEYPKGRVVPRGQIKTLAQAMDYAAAGYKVCLKNGWTAAANLYLGALTHAYDGGVSVKQVVDEIYNADMAAAKSAADMPRARVGTSSNPRPINTSAAAPPIPEQLPGATMAGLGGMSPLMLVAAGAGFWFFVLPALKGKKGGGRKAGRRKR